MTIFSLSNIMSSNKATSSYSLDLREGQSVPAGSTANDNMTTSELDTKNAKEKGIIIGNERLSYENVSTSEVANTDFVSSCNASPNKKVDTFSDASSDLIVRSRSSQNSDTPKEQQSNVASPSAMLKGSGGIILRARSYSDLSLDPSVLSGSMLESAEKISKDIIGDKTKNHEHRGFPNKKNETDHERGVLMSNDPVTSNLEGTVEENLESSADHGDDQLPSEVFLNVGQIMQLKTGEESKLDSEESSGKQVRGQEREGEGSGPTSRVKHLYIEDLFFKWTRSLAGKIVVAVIFLLLPAGLWFGSNLIPAQDNSPDSLISEEKETSTIGLDVAVATNLRETLSQLNITESPVEDCPGEKIAATIDLFSSSSKTEDMNLGLGRKSDLGIEEVKDSQTDCVLDGDGFSFQNIEEPSNEGESTVSLLLQFSEEMWSRLSETFLPNQVVEAGKGFPLNQDSVADHLSAGDEVPYERIEGGNKGESSISLLLHFFQEILSKLSKKILPDQAVEAEQKIDEEKSYNFEHYAGSLAFVMVLLFVLLPSGSASDLGDETIPEEEDTDFPAGCNDSEKEEDLYTTLELDDIPGLEPEEDDHSVPKIKPERFAIPEKLEKYENLRVKKDLRRLLRDRGLKVSGRKHELIIRLGEAYEKELYQKTVKDLKSILREKQLPVTGIKQDLVRRLVQAGFDRV